MTDTQKHPLWAVNIGLIVVCLCIVGLTVSAGVTSAQTAAYAPQDPYVGMEVTASSGSIQDGEFYDLRVVKEFDGGTVSSHRFVEELQADGTEVVIETDSLEPGSYYFVSGPGLDSPTGLTESQTFELREQTLGVQVGNDDTDTNASTDEQDDDLDTARYYGTVTIGSEPAPINTTIQATVDGEVRGEVIVETPGAYGNATGSEDQLAVGGPSIGEQPNVSFYVIPPDAGRIAADQSVVRDPGTRMRLNLTAEQSSDGGTTANDGATENSTVDNGTNVTTASTNETADEPSASDATTDTTPGFGIGGALVSLAALGLLGHRRRG